MLVLAMVGMAAGVLAAGWGFLHLDRDAAPEILVAAGAGSFVALVSIAAALLAFAAVVRPREPVLVVDAFGIFDRRVAPTTIPWTSIRKAYRVGHHLTLDVDGWDGAGSDDVPRRRLRRAVIISTRGLTCTASDIEIAIRRGLDTKTVKAA
jgi:hypothetical protein